jgi:hypothetical protein
MNRHWEEASMEGPLWRFLYSFRSNELTNIIWKSLSPITLLIDKCELEESTWRIKIRSFRIEMPVISAIFFSGIETDQKLRSVMKISLFVSIKWINKHDRHHQFYFWLVNFLNFWKCQFWSPPPNESVKNRMPMYYKPNST